MRDIVGAVVPLAGRPLYSSLGLGWGNILSAFIALAVVPLPMLIMRFVEKMRSRGKTYIADLASE